MISNYLINECVVKLTLDKRPWHWTVISEKEIGTQFCGKREGITLGVWEGFTEVVTWQLSLSCQVRDKLEEEIPGRVYQKCTSSSKDDGLLVCFDWHLMCIKVG